MLTYLENILRKPHGCVIEFVKYYVYYWKMFCSHVNRRSLVVQWSYTHENGSQGRYWQVLSLTYLYCRRIDPLSGRQYRSRCNNRTKERLAVLLPQRRGLYCDVWYLSRRAAASCEFIKTSSFPMPMKCLKSFH